MKKICGIYKITSPSKKVYVGQAIDICKRFNDYDKMRCKGQPIIYNSLKKYGPEKHKFEILCECSIEELNEKERYYQDLYSCIGKNGLNLKLTKAKDRSGKHSEESKKKMSESKKGDKNPMYNKPISETTRAKRRISLGGCNHPQWGIPHAESTRAKRRISLKNNTNAKRTIVINTQTGIFYDSIREANDSLGSHKYSVLKHKLRGGPKGMKNNTALIYA